MAEGTLENVTVGIIGGQGQLGAWCRDLFAQRGFTVMVADIGTELSNLDVARGADIVVVSVPIGTTQAVLDQIVDALGAHQLIVDLTSVKTPFMPTMERSLGEVLSLHPMFAPKLSTKKGQTCIVCPIRAGRLSQIFEGVLREEGLNLVTMTPEAHDRAMAIVQGLTHFQAIASAHTMATLNFRPSETLKMSSPVYRLRLAMIGRVLAQNPRLYAEIQIFNPFVREVLERLQSTNQRLLDLIIARDVDGFTAEFSWAREVLGSFSSEAIEELSRVV